jgi:chemotaxis protein MotB
VAEEEKPAEAQAAPPEDQAADAAAAPAEGAAPPAEGEEGAEPLAPIIVKKIIDEGHGGAHGGAWKIALADMMTAMMAFFLLMWLLGATNTDQRKSIADYFKPTAATEASLTISNTSGSTGIMGGQSIIDEEALPNPSVQTGLMTILQPRESTGSKDSDKAKDDRELSDEEKKRAAQEADRENFEKLEQELNERMSGDKELAKLKDKVNMVREKEGLRIEIIDKADFAMFPVGTNKLSPKAVALIAEIARSLGSMKNKLKVRGHTDSLPYNGTDRNNWTLSADRAEATRQQVIASGVDPKRISRIEGVADTEPYNAADPKDPRNRRISITVLYTNQ